MGLRGGGGTCERKQLVHTQLHTAKPHFMLVVFACGAMHRFPNASAMIEEFHNMGVRVIFWITNMIDQDSPNYQEGYDNGYYVKCVWNFEPGQRESVCACVRACVYVCACVCVCACVRVCVRVCA